MTGALFHILAAEFPPTTIDTACCMVLGQNTELKDAVGQLYMLFVHTSPLHINLDLHWREVFYISADNGPIAIERASALLHNLM